MEAEKLNELPPLPELPVIRDTYCSQEMTDQLVRFLEKNNPELLLLLAKQEKEDNCPSRHGHTEFGEVTLKISNFLQAQEIFPGVIGNNSSHIRLATLDFLYELSRRVRKVLGLADIPVVGIPLASGPEGPFPILLHPAALLARFPPSIKDGVSIPSITQDEVNQILEKAYGQKPELFYELAEEMRRSIKSSDIDATLSVFLQASAVPGLMAEVRGRLSRMCEIKWKNADEPFGNPKNFIGKIES